MEAFGKLNEVMLEGNEKSQAFKFVYVKYCSSKIKSQ